MRIQKLKPFIHVRANPVGFPREVERTPNLPTKKLLYLLIVKSDDAKSENIG